MFRKFEEIIAWQKGQDIAVDIYHLFSKIKDSGFKNQIFRAVVSISNNIAEGFERGTDNEFKRYLKISKASCSEVKSMLYLSIRLKYLDNNTGTDLINKCSEIIMIINGLIKSLTNDKIKKNELITDA